MSRLIASGLGVGFLRPAPGTWGSALAVLLAWALLGLGGVWLFVAALALLVPVGWFAVADTLRLTTEADPPWIVVDEVAGQWVALLPAALGSALMGVEPLRLWPAWVAGFVLFRLFDIWKPWIVGRGERQPGARGVMLDDLAAGLLAALGVVALAALAHLGLMR